MALLKKNKPSFLERKGKWKKFSPPGGKKTPIRDAIAKKKSEASQSSKNKSSAKKSASKKAAKKPTKAAASNKGSGNKKAAKVTTKPKKPAKQYVRKRPDLGGKKAVAPKAGRFGTGTMVGGRQKFDAWGSKNSKWNRMVSKNWSNKEKRGNQWHTDQFMKAVRAVRREDPKKFDAEVSKLRKDPNAVNVKGHTINLGMSDYLKDRIDAMLERNSSHTKRFSQNWNDEKLDTHGRKSVKAMKRRAKALFYTVQFGPDGKAK